MKILRIIILERSGVTDFVRMTTDLPSPFPPGVSDQELSIDFSTQQGKAREYVEEHFPGVPVEVIEVKH